ncbi:antibiotic biosynthesis monooxygenase [Amycolatopsis sp. FBCC-B4732]|uniref:antibiotic biosynthesis monooxygenase family protein n=1 Tax=Amycolatopsis sp. FBCC-B4732 TaxID=3079339 RepID=UPI001FF2FA67|nr:antibiotic biosynthesis monooxygenase family protein [Amycolatopsis sp. FBCC-B4732]UOX90497.1 antibiotic biosynthesis monooxygenase [Amycolatopsis sp. FBCC-B4732]
MLVVISTFTVPPGKQRELLDLLRANAEEVLRHQPGFVTADLLATPDGTTVVNHARWTGAAAVRTMMEDPATRERMAPAWAIARPVVQQFTVSSTHVPAK